MNALIGPETGIAWGNRCQVLNSGVTWMGLGPDRVDRTGHRRFCSRGSSPGSWYSRPNGPIAVTWVTYSPDFEGSPTMTARRTAGGSAGNGFQSMFSGSTDRKTASPG